MITVKEALNLVRKHSSTAKGSRSIDVVSSYGSILSEEINAPISLPSFRQSVMDGYAIRFHAQNSIKKDSDQLSFMVVGEIKAGDAMDVVLNPGEAVRIFTGARVPENGDAVVIQEKSIIKNDHLLIGKLPKTDENIRKIGSQIQKGNLALEKGHYINPASIGLLRSLGIEKVEVCESLKVTVVVTGNELVSPGKPLAIGEIYESNSAVLKAALSYQGVKEVNILYSKDTLEETQLVLEKALSRSDLVLISGGISVGDYDFVGQALLNLGVQEIFYKVLQKPGKPLFFGKKNTSYVFALPGNPASTLTCYFVYVTLLIDILKNSNHLGLLRLQLPIGHSFTNSFKRALFLKARVNKDQVSVLNQQNSSTVISFASANALVYIPEDVENINKDDLVETLILPYGSSN